MSSPIHNSEKVSELTLSMTSDNPNPSHHQLHHRTFFTPGQYLECLHSNRFHVGKVIESIPDSHFRIELDSCDPTFHARILTYFYHTSTGTITKTTSTSSTTTSTPPPPSTQPQQHLHTLFPCTWCASNNLAISPPSNWPHDQPFSWQATRFGNNDLTTQNLTQPSHIHSLFNWSRTLSQLAEKFPVGAYLECAPSGSHVIGVGQIKAKIEHLVFVEMVHEATTSPLQRRLHVFSVDSTELFPVGWAEMNDYYEQNEELYRRYVLVPMPLSSESNEEKMQAIKSIAMGKISYFSRLSKI